MQSPLLGIYRSFSDSSRVLFIMSPSAAAKIVPLEKTFQYIVNAAFRDSRSSRLTQLKFPSSAEISIGPSLTGHEPSCYRIWQQQQESQFVLPWGSLSSSDTLILTESRELKERVMAKCKNIQLFHLHQDQYTTTGRTTLVWRCVTWKWWWPRRQLSSLDSR